MAAKWFKTELSLGNILSIGTMIVGATVVVVTADLRGQQAQTRLDAVEDEIQIARVQIAAVSERVAIVETQIAGMVQAIQLGNARYEAIADALGGMRIDIARVQTLLRDLSAASP